MNHLPRLFGIEANERGNGVEGVEEKVRVDLAGEGGKAGFDEQRLLSLEFAFIAGVIPDLEGERNGEHGGAVGGNHEQG